MRFALKFDFLSPTKREKRKKPKKRKMKGKSIRDFLSEYCVVDVETTGLSSEIDEIIEIGAIKYFNGEAIEKFQSLIRPSNPEKIMDKTITRLTGITNQMLADAPKIGDVLTKFSKFLGNDTIVGYNVNFDINFLYDNFIEHLGKPLTNDFVDVQQIVSSIYHNFPHYRLGTVLEYFGISNDKKHRSLADCESTHLCYEKLKQIARAGYEHKEDFIKVHIPKIKHKRGKFLASEISGNKNKINKSSPFYNRRCVFTGQFAKLTRGDAMQVIADIGGINQNSVTKKTDFLVLGNFDYCRNMKDKKSSKLKKAEKYKMEGQNIQIISEKTFYEMVANDI